MTSEIDLESKCWHCQRPDADQNPEYHYCDDCRWAWQRSAEGAAHKMEIMLGAFLSALSSLGARIAGWDLAMRRIIDKEVYNSRVEVSEAFSRLADEECEPPDG
jgi:hypothetical protein